MRLLRRRASTFDVQVQDLVLRITAPEEVAEESRAAALSFWEQLQSYALRHPEFRTSKRPIPDVEPDAPAVVREMVAAATAAAVGPMFTFRGAVVDQVGRFLAASVPEVTVACDGDYFIKARRRVKLAVRRHDADPIPIAIEPEPAGVGVSTTLGRGRGGVGPDGLAVVADSCMLADAAAAGVQAIVTKPDGFGVALHYLRRVPGVRGAVVVVGDRIGLCGGVEIVA
ncbi:MAG: hypothetical protein KatS3mg013_0139 [Actinomycetota bacterium]|nr:MAG: hypothetical protein KatS3mg013_0139 [Actinomycetota bacterium]